MNFHIVTRVFALTACALALAACQASSIMNTQTIDYNRTVADSTNEFFLLNALRASDRFPIYYSRTTGTNSAVSVNPSLEYGVSGWVQSPTLTLGGSQSNTLSLSNLDDQKFMRGVLMPVPLSTLDFYYGQSWPKEVLLMMYLKKIQIDAKLAANLADQFDAQCNATDAAASEYCDNTRPHVTDSNLKEVVDRPSVTARRCFKNDVVMFDNYPSMSDKGQGPTQVDCFQAMLRVLIKLGFAPLTGNKFTVISRDVPEASVDDLKGTGDATAAKLVISRREKSEPAKYAVCTKSDAAGFTLDQKVIDSFSESIGEKISQSQGGRDSPDNHAVTQTETSLIVSLAPTCAAQAERDEDRARKTRHCAAKPKPRDCEDKPALVFSFTTRSLDTMIYYLGEMHRAGDTVNIWRFQPGRSATVEKLFYVLRESDTEPLVATEYRGKRYTIPDSCPDEEHCTTRHRSLQVFSLLNQIWGMQKEATDAPSVPIVSVVGH